MARQTSSARCLASFVRKAARTIAAGARQALIYAPDIDIPEAANEGGSFDIGDLFDAVAPIFDSKIFERYDDGIFFLDHNHARLMFDQERNFQQQRVVPYFEKIDLLLEVGIFLVAQDLLDPLSSQNFFVAQKTTHSTSVLAARGISNNKLQISDSNLQIKSFRFHATLST
jgi:hypothetical protein